MSSTLESLGNTSSVATPSRGRRRPVWLAASASVLIVLTAFAFRGRMTTIYSFDSLGLSSTRGTGTESYGGAGPFTLARRPASFRWHLNAEVVAIHVAVAPSGPQYRSLLSKGLRPDRMPRVEFSTFDRSGTWSLASLPPGTYWANYRWSTRGAETGRWTFEVRQRLPWWQKGGHNSGS